MDVNRKTLVIIGSESVLCKKAASALGGSGINVVLVVNDPNVMNEEDIAYKKVHADSEEELRAIKEAVLKEYGSIDYLIKFVTFQNVQGDGSLPETETKLWLKAKDESLSLLYRISKTFIDEMVENKRGRVLIVGSVKGMMPIRGQDISCAVNSGAFMAAKILAAELAQYNIIVNALALGAEDQDKNMPFDSRLKEHIPLKRPIFTEEILNVIEYLLTGAPDYLTGTVIPLDGGLTSAYIREW